MMKVIQREYEEKGIPDFPAFMAFYDKRHTCINKNVRKIKNSFGLENECSRLNVSDG